MNGTDFLPTLCAAAGVDLPEAPGSDADAQPPDGWSPMRFIKEAELGGFAMYDLSTDPSETTDLARRDPERFAAMRARMIELHREIRAEGPTLRLQPDRPARGR